MSDNTTPVFAHGLDLAPCCSVPLALAYRFTLVPSAH